jgi:histidine triad (HIT) family protein
MTAVQPHDPACLFCQIAAGRRPAELVYQSDSAVAFLDRFPTARGHTLVVPRRHAPSLLQLDEGAAGALFGSVMEVLDRLQGALHPAGFNIGWNQGAVAGQTIFHLHVHVMPRFGGGGAGVQAVGEGSPREPLEAIAEAIRGAGHASPSRATGRSGP